STKALINIEQTFPNLSFRLPDISFSDEKVNRKRIERQQEDEDETTSNSSSSNKEDFINVENLIVHSKRGAPRKKWLKGSNELVNKYISGAKQSEIHKARKPTQC
ncbi:28037_t:CDS:2, partial [Dentiscutata erythropus]